MSQRPKKPVSSTVAPLLSHIYSQLAAEKAVLHTSSTAPVPAFCESDNFSLFLKPLHIPHLTPDGGQGVGSWDQDVHWHCGLCQCSLCSTHHTLLLGSTCPMSLPGHMSGTNSTHVWSPQHTSSPGFTHQESYPELADLVISWIHMCHITSPITSNTVCQICKSHITFRIPHLPSYPESTGHMLPRGSVYVDPGSPCPMPSVRSLRPTSYPGSSHVL